jgi:hypothetical protein
MDDAGLRDRLLAFRAREKRKRPFERTLFDRINGLVRAHALGGAFLARLAGAGEEPHPEHGREGRVKAKELFEPPLFSLSSEDEYRVTMAILNAVNNPYLRYAASPDEILLCGPLFRRNPRLGPDTLARHHFEALLLAETAKREIPDLTGQVHFLLEKGGLAGEDRARLSSLEERIERLRRFVASAEGADSGRE